MDAQVEPTVGMHCTMMCGSDRYPYEVISVVNKRTVVVAELDRRFNDDFETVTFVPRKHKYPETFTRRSCGLWLRKGVSKGVATCRLTLGHADFYQDPHR